MRRFCGALAISSIVHIVALVAVALLQGLPVFSTQTPEAVSQAATAARFSARVVSVRVGRPSFGDGAVAVAESVEAPVSVPVAVSDLKSVAAPERVNAASRRGEALQRPDAIRQVATEQQGESVQREDTRQAIITNQKSGGGQMVALAGRLPETDQSPVAGQESELGQGAVSPNRSAVQEVATDLDADSEFADAEVVSAVASQNGVALTYAGSLVGGTGVSVRPSSVIDPMAIWAPEPEYPMWARRRGQSGTVLLAVRIGLQGVPQAVSIVQGSGFALLDSAAERAVWQWRFEPGRVDGAPAEKVVEVPVVFRLQARLN